MPKEKKKKLKGDKESSEQNIPEEVLKQLPPEVQAQLGYQEEQKPIFKPTAGSDAGLSDSIDRLREGFEKIGLTLIGRMGEFASTLERVVMTVARIDKVEKKTAETTYFLQNLQKTLDGFKRDFGKIVDKIDSIEIDIERIAGEITNLKSTGIPTIPAPASPPAPESNQSVSAPTTPMAPSSPIPEPDDTPVTPTAAPVAPARPAPARVNTTPAKPASDNPIDVIFADLQNNAVVGSDPGNLADLLDQARTKISEESKWTPALYELGKLARKLRKSNIPLSEGKSNEIQAQLEQWRTQIVG